MMKRIRLGKLAAMVAALCVSTAIASVGQTLTTLASFDGHDETGSSIIEGRWCSATALRRVRPRRTVRPRDARRRKAQALPGEGQSERSARLLAGEGALKRLLVVTQQQ